MQDWQDDIVQKVVENHNHRPVVFWGKYGVSEKLSQRLLEECGIKTAFYVDGDSKKVDNRLVFPPAVLDNNFEQYYVVITLAVYASIRNNLANWGYQANKDYYYFSDCIVKETEDYYEDAHGNIFIGCRKNIKFAFSGWGSIIRIGDNVQLDEMELYFPNDVQVNIGEKSKILNTRLWFSDGAKLTIGVCSDIHNTRVNMGKGTMVEVGGGGQICYTEFVIGETAIVSIGSNVIMHGVEHCLQKVTIEEKAKLILGNKSTINSDYRWTVGAHTTLEIGMDCMFSYGVWIRTDDGHSIFDVKTSCNINSTESMQKTRKIKIGNHVWVGMRASILYNTGLGDGCIVGACSLVKSRVPNNCLIAGSPARIIKKDVAWSRQNGADDIMLCGSEHINYTQE